MNPTTPVHYAPRGLRRHDDFLPTVCGIPIRLNRNGDVRKGQPAYMGGGRERFVSCPLCRQRMLTEGDLTEAEFAEQPRIWSDDYLSSSRDR